MASVGLSYFSIEIKELLYEDPQTIQNNRLKKLPFSKYSFDACHKENSFVDYPYRYTQCIMCTQYGTLYITVYVCMYNMYTVTRQRIML